ncbi:hypothetical protein LIER_41265 [Lithospermum erythrorhizon]|uniref:Uncharacterized protein n=1 Tax=Lithospermum erythrorhizon TaxID=34254 RepID=A0AAV3RCI1_LITER
MLFFTTTSPPILFLIRILVFCFHDSLSFPRILSPQARTNGIAPLVPLTPPQEGEVCRGRKDGIPFFFSTSSREACCGPPGTQVFPRQGSLRCSSTHPRSGVVRRVTKLSPGPQASHEVSRLWLQAASASLALSAGNSALHRLTLELSEGLSKERLKIVALEQELRGLRLQATTSSNLPWELALTFREQRKGGKTTFSKMREQGRLSLNRSKMPGGKGTTYTTPTARRSPYGTAASGFVLHNQDRVSQLSVRNQ